MRVVIETELMPVLVDGGSKDGCLVTADGRLAAVFVMVTAGDVGDGADDGGWFLEAGFGPCGLLRQSAAPVFPDMKEALRWVANQVAVSPPG